MNCKTKSCKEKATHTVMWPGEGAIFYCKLCANKAAVVIRAMGLTPKIGPMWFK